MAVILKSDCGLQAMVKTLLLHSSLMVSLCGLALGEALGQERLELAGARFHGACSAYEPDPRTEEAVMNSTLCSGYIQGFLSAAGVLKARGAEKLSYRERALNTRAQGLLSREEGMRYAKYCVPADATIGDLAARVSRVTFDPARMPFAKNIVENVLREHYRCGK